jgi:hypothetical protein
VRQRRHKDLDPGVWPPVLGYPAPSICRTQRSLRTAVPANTRWSEPGCPFFAELLAGALQATAIPDNDPTLLDELPTAAGVLAHAPDRIKQALLTAFDIYALYNKETDQVTIRAALTQNTPRHHRRPADRPRTDDDTSQHSTTHAIKTPAQDPISEFGRVASRSPGSTARPGSTTETRELNILNRTKGIRGGCNRPMADPTT